MQRRAVPGSILVALGLAAITPLQAQRCLPFAAGETLNYGIRVAMMGARGKAVMSVTGPEELRGRLVLRLRSEAHVGVGFLRGSDATASWIDPLDFASLRFIQHEHHIISNASDSVEIFPEQRRWQRGNGTDGAMRTDAPLDVLSFIYFLRTLPFGPDSAWVLDRHFDDLRNPTKVRVVGRDTIDTPAGKFDAWSVEMQVRDTAHVGQGVSRLDCSGSLSQLWRAFREARMQHSE